MVKQDNWLTVKGTVFHHVTPCSLLGR